MEQFSTMYFTLFALLIAPAVAMGPGRALKSSKAPTTKSSKAPSVPTSSTKSTKSSTKSTKSSTSSIGECFDEICRFKLEGSADSGLCLHSGGPNNFLLLRPCVDDEEAQTWRIYAGEGAFANIQDYVPPGDPNVESYWESPNNVGEQVRLEKRFESGSQKWDCPAPQADGKFSSFGPDGCIGVEDNCPADRGCNATWVDCEDSPTFEKFDCSDDV